MFNTDSSRNQFTVFYSYRHMNNRIGAAAYKYAQAPDSLHLVFKVKY